MKDIDKYLKENRGKKYDICLMNPPYGYTGSNVIHLRFVDKILDISNKQVVIFPYSFIVKKNNKLNNKFKEKFSKYLTEVEEVESSKFSGTHMPNVGIYIFDSNKKEDNIKIKPLNTELYKVSSLLSLSKFSDYENEIIKYLENQGSQDILGDCGRLNSWKGQIQGLTNNEKQEKILELVKASLKKVKKYYDKYPNSYGLLVNRANGGCNGTALSSKNGQILKNYNEFINYFCKNLLGIGYCSLMFKSKIEAENCKEALKRPLLRFTLYRLQDDQNMTPRVYKYIPNIDWSDDRVKTDEGLLEVCGCPKDKCKEYADYCRKVIEEVDNR